MEMIPVYIIIVTYNGAKWLRQCLATALASDTSVQLVIIDNGSTDKTLDIIMEFPQHKIHLIQTGENLGFGKANNVGIENAIKEGAEYIYLLNQDAYLEPNTISSLVALMQQDPQYAILSPMQYNGDGTLLDRNFEYNCLLKSTVTVNENIRDTQFVMAAHWLVSTHIVKVTGGFSPLFYHYGEDVDFCNLLIYLGYKIGIVTSCKGYHDRKDRKNTLEKDIYIKYMTARASLTNPNENLIRSITNVFRIFLSDILKPSSNSTIALRIKYSGSAYMQLLKLMPSIIRNRKKVHRLKKYNAK